MIWRGPDIPGSLNAIHFPSPDQEKPVHSTHIPSVFNGTGLPGKSGPIFPERGMIQIPLLDIRARSFPSGDSFTDGESLVGILIFVNFGPGGITASFSATGINLESIS